MNGQMNRGVLELCILQAVDAQPLHGYALMKQMAEVFPGVEESTVYAILRRLRQDGKLEVVMEEAAADARRKAYRLTPAGVLALEEARVLWRATVRAVRSFGIFDESLTKS